MTVDIQTHGIAMTDPLRSYVQEKSDKIKKYDPTISRITISLSDDEPPLNQVAKGTVITGKSVIRATGRSDDMFASIDKLEAKLAKQLKKQRDKLKTKAIRKPAVIIPESAPPKPDPLCLDKPTFVEDAIRHLESGDYPFVVFQDAQSRKLTILYESQAGIYDLIQPSVSAR